MKNKNKIEKKNHPKRINLFQKHKITKKIMRQSKEIEQKLLGTRGFDCAKFLAAWIKVLFLKGRAGTKLCLQLTFSKDPKS